VLRHGDKLKRKQGEDALRNTGKEESLSEGLVRE
jgi:hypothetical protein